jgi:hypothetical protein
VPSSEGRSIKRNVGPTHQSNYVAFTEVIKMLNFKIRKHIKLITINLKVVTLIVLQAFKINPSKYCNCMDHAYKNLCQSYADVRKAQVTNNIK